MPLYPYGSYVAYAARCFDSGGEKRGRTVRTNASEPTDERLSRRAVTHQVLLRSLRGRPVHVARINLRRVVRDDCRTARGRDGDVSRDEGARTFQSGSRGRRILLASPSAGGSTWDAIVATRARFASRGSSINRANPRGLTSRGRRGRGERESRGDARLRRALSRGKRKVQAAAHTAKGKRRWWCGFSRWDRAGARTYPLPEAPASRLIPLNRSRTCAHAWVSAPCAAFAPRDRSPASRTRGLREDSALGARRARCNPGDYPRGDARRS